MSISLVTNEDNMAMMSRYPDKFFDLAIVDPPYGINADEKNSKKELKSKKSASVSKSYGDQRWDSAIPDQEYFDELKRVSKHQIIWGANYFGLVGGYIYWNKCVTMPTYSDGELAYCSLINSIKSFTFAWHGMIQGDMKNKEERYHPTQKPVALYLWLLKKFGKTGQSILDTHLGSGSSRIAAYDLGFDFYGCELDTDYFDAQENRFAKHIAQQKLFTPQQAQVKAEQITLL
jgi:site-specific DNA-methyltransferase (adenine-specific)